MKKTLKAMAVEGIKANYEIPRVSNLSEIDFHNEYFLKEGLNI